MPLSFFQTDIDLSGTFKPQTGPNITDQFLEQLQATGTDTLAFITIYPFQGLGDKVTDQQLSDLGARLNKIANSGRSIFLRYAPEMNAKLTEQCQIEGNWFVYGQNAKVFKDSYRRAVTFLRNALGPNASKVAFVWAPNSGNNYPFGNGAYAPDPTTPDGQARLRDLDTNADNKFDPLDDPYSPYYPGDDVVDWVGLSVYHYGTDWPWIENVAPLPGKFEGYINGQQRPMWGTFPFYDMFCGKGSNVSAGNKPFMIAESAATYHYAFINPTAPNQPPTPIMTDSRLTIKQTWWRQYLNTTLLSKFPMLKAVSTFEFVKDEETTRRDFTMFGAPPNGFNEDNDVMNAFIKDAAGYDFLQWASKLKANASTTQSSVVATATVGVPTVAPGGNNARNNGANGRWNTSSMQLHLILGVWCLVALMTLVLP
ncbi:hypothetical protein HDU76_004437 [Blyttiomyces sp. JEL0837]|nr:hypothetical protein HDU76_004437 [Blyttiomyces sp. JEL0837]